jgi:hypothetical protein
MFNLLGSPYDLSTKKTMLIELKYTFYLKGANIRRTFPTQAFAAQIVVDDRTALLRSLDDVCFQRITEATKFTSYSRCCLSDYEVERYLIWEGLDDAKLSLSGLSDWDFQTQLELVDRRGWQDRLRVHMAFEVDLQDQGEVDEGSDGTSATEDGISVGKFVVAP